MTLYPLCISLTAAMESVQARNGGVSDEEALRMFLGQECGFSRLDMVDFGLALDILVDCFFMEWSKSRGRTFAYQAVLCLTFAISRLSASPLSPSLLL